MKSAAALVSFVTLTWLAIACETRVDLGRNDGTSAARDGGAEPTDSSPSTLDTSCEGACNKLFLCGLVSPLERTSCYAECDANATAEQRSCIVASTCAQLQENCGTRGFEETDDAASDHIAVFECKDACDTAQFHSCLSAAEHSRCRERCDGAESAPRASFNACMRASAADCAATRDCWSVFSQ